MATNPPITPAPAKLRKIRSDAGKPRYEYYVTNAGIPCRVDSSKTLHKKPILVPCLPGEALDIVGRGYGKKRIETMINRTVEAVKQAMGNTIFEKTPQMKAAIARYSGSGDWQIVKRKAATESAGTEG